MRLGCDLPYFSDPGEIREFAQAAEELGYDHIAFSEHVASAQDSPFPQTRGRGPSFSFEDPWHESFTLLGFLAAATSRIELSTSMMLLGLRPTVLAAKQAAEIDLLSQGRLRLGVALGWNPREYEALGVDPRTRGDRIAEQVEVMRRLWSEPAVTYEGSHLRLRQVGISPRPARRIPIWMGAGSFASSGRPPGRALRRMARLADGYKMFAVLGGDRETALDVFQTLRRYTAQAGRDPDQMGVEARLITHREPPEQWPDTARFWADAGATHLGLGNRAFGGALEDQIQVITHAMARIGPVLEPGGEQPLSAVAGPAAVGIRERSPADVDQEETAS
jgi:probable F420-dependent oxidoreductase